MAIIVEPVQTPLGAVDWYGSKRFACVFLSEYLEYILYVIEEMIFFYIAEYTIIL